MKNFVNVKRLIPEGGINPNLNLPYANMKEKLIEYQNMFEEAFCDIPVSIRRKFSKEAFIEENEYWQDPSHEPNEIIGFVYFIHDDSMDISIENKMLFDTLKNPRIEIVSTIDKNHEDKSKIYIKKIIKFLISDYPESK